MNFFYHHPAPEYREHNPAGGLNIASHEWNETNGTYVFSYGLGCVNCRLGDTHRSHLTFPQGCCGRQFPRDFHGLFKPSLSSLQPRRLGFQAQEFGARISVSRASGLLVVKDSIMLGAAILTMADSAKTYLKRIVLRPSF